MAPRLYVEEFAGTGSRLEAFGVLASGLQIFSRNSTLATSQMRYRRELDSLAPARLLFGRGPGDRSGLLVISCIHVVG